MDFEWDSDKHLRERGFGFDVAALVFDSRTVCFEDARADYGEIRMIAIGEIAEKLYTVVYTDRGAVRRIISAHRSSRQEVNRWQSSE